MLARPAPLSGRAAALRARARARAGVRAVARRCAVAEPRAALRVFALSLVLCVAVALLFPATAMANPVTDAIEDAIQSVLGWVFERVMGGLFGGIQGKVTEELAQWLVAIPNFDPDMQQQFVEGTARSNIDAARQATSMLALGGLGAVMTLSVIRYWLSGLSMRGSGGIEAFEGFSRTLLAVGMILLWPEAFRLLVALVNTGTDTLLSWPSVRESVAGLWGWTTAITAGAFALGAPVAVIITIIVFVAFALLMLGLVLMKVMLTAGTALIYVLMPIALVLWPLPETSWVARVTGRAFLVCLLIPVTWTVIFITFAALGADFFTLRGQGGVLDRVIITPLAAIGMLSLSIIVPKALGKAALMGAINSTGGNAGGGGAGFMGRMASSLAARRADAALGQHVPSSWGGRLQPPSGATGHGGFMSAARNMVASMTGRAGGGTAGAGSGQRGRGGGPRGGPQGGGQNGGQPRGGQRGGGQNGAQQRGQRGQGQGGRQAPGGGPPRPTMRQMRERAAQWSAAGGPSPALVQGALAELSPRQQAGVADAARTRSPGDFQHQMFANAQNPAHSESTKGAYFVLGSAGAEQVGSFTGGGSGGGGGGGGGTGSGGGGTGGGGGGGTGGGGGFGGGGSGGGGGGAGGSGGGGSGGGNGNGNGGGNGGGQPSMPTPQPPTTTT